MSGQIVIVGAGIAGATAARTLRADGYTGRIVLVGGEDRLPYRRPMVSKEFLAGTAVERRALLESAESWRDNEIDVRVGATVEEIDAARGRVRLHDGTVLGYDSLLLATGARARQLPGPQRGIHTLRGRADAEGLRTALTEGGSLLVVGGGLIGCEVAATARGLGAEVTVVHAGPHPLDRIAPPVVGAHVRNLHADNGVTVHDDTLLRSLAGGSGGVVAETEDGRRFTAAVALVAIGSVPDIELAAAAGLETGDGILVDERYRTSAESIYAAGDVASRYDPRLGIRERGEHWNGAQSQGAAAAKSILGATPPPPEVPWGWTTQYGHTIQFAGRLSPADDILLRRASGTPQFTALARSEGRLVGAVAVGRPADIRAARALIAQGAVLDPACADAALELTAQNFTPATQ
ncbi:3-phenylpropionate/trans-cinnamate dioxygenase ferredoxin reductase subunit [Nocardia transvalensis]|uniref:3-phenylpropionate/trans-cinnamate dioxygenase ferredoxin reductase subunit n=1 Tax=Nocardia transvalensis TaxID=37333 RepID=A0A7W9PGA2_9NOCA|nr:FAD-dependent oxidoreductase [Nocardia transvalensis]MBB5915641.1 3-phenylpropionate/trans-cinnamate dioxygenase ferredoxin reductase subunit [Nocardia transvalensis]